jgi:hypothetical protein
LISWKRTLKTLRRQVFLNPSAIKSTWSNSVASSSKPRNLKIVRKPLCPLIGFLICYKFSSRNKSANTKTTIQTPSLNQKASGNKSMRAGQKYKKEIKPN